MWQLGRRHLCAVLIAICGSFVSLLMSIYTCTFNTRSVRNCLLRPLTHFMIKLLGSLLGKEPSQTESWIWKVKPAMLSVDFITKSPPDIAAAERSNSAVTYLEFRSKPTHRVMQGKRRIFITQVHWRDPCGHTFTVSSPPTHRGDTSLLLTYSSNAKILLPPTKA